MQKYCFLGRCFVTVSEFELRYKGYMRALEKPVLRWTRVYKLTQKRRKKRLQGHACTLQNVSPSMLFLVQAI